jgi:protein SCO1/2
MRKVGIRSILVRLLTQVVFLAGAWAYAQAVNGIPDVTLVNQHGTQVRLQSDLMGKGVVVVNFVFTTCTTICPPMGATFGKLQKLLQERGHSGVQLVSISVDPVTDTPDKLLAWGEKFHAGPKWTLLTGDKASIDKVRRAFSAYTQDKSAHSSVAFIGNAAKGKWTTGSSIGQVEELYKKVVSLE